MKHKIKEGSAYDQLLNLESNSIDCIITDPPYGYSLMGLDWDKGVIPADTWAQCLRVLKPGGFAAIMSAPRQDVYNILLNNLRQAGFSLEFTGIKWAYASGFPKATNTSKAVDRKLGAKREITGYDQNWGRQDSNIYRYNATMKDKTKYPKQDKPATQHAKELDGSYLGYQPKPAVEEIVIAMKPLSEKNYIEQALKNQKGISWLDDGRIPTADTIKPAISGGSNGLGLAIKGHKFTPHKDGRFPANLLVSDNSLGDEFSKYFNLDDWAAQFIIEPKPTTTEKEAGLTASRTSLAEFSSTETAQIYNDSNPKFIEQLNDSLVDTNITKLRINDHVSIKPISLMAYLITLFSRPGDMVLDPFCGSGTTLTAAELLGRHSIGIEKSHHNTIIAHQRLRYWADKTMATIQKMKKDEEKNQQTSLGEFN